MTRKRNAPTDSSLQSTPGTFALHFDDQSVLTDFTVFEGRDAVSSLSSPVLKRLYFSDMWGKLSTDLMIKKKKKKIKFWRKERDYVWLQGGIFPTNMY